MEAHRRRLTEGGPMLWIVAFLVGYLFLNHYLLPKLGVPT
jgi:hypothetical protein